MMEILTAAGLAAIGCAELPGAEALIRQPEVGFVLVGEYHGTNEMPAVARDIACAAAKAGRPLVFGVELPAAVQPEIDAYLASDGRPAARTKLLASPVWCEKGGRTTVAIVETIDALRRLGTRYPVTVIAFDAAPAVRGTSKHREAAMAKALKVAAYSRPSALVVALTGSGHADRNGWPAFPSAVQWLPRANSVSLTFARPGGHYWGCHAPNGEASKGCTTYTMPVREPVAERGLTFDPELRSGFDGVYSPGRAYTASKPAVRPSQCRQAD